MLPGFDGTYLLPVFRSSKCIHASHSVMCEGDIVSELLFCVIDLPFYEIILAFMLELYSLS